MPAFPTQAGDGIPTQADPLEIPRFFDPYSNIYSGVSSVLPNFAMPTIQPFDQAAAADAAEG
jgi:hypothetical protein